MALLVALFALHGVAVGAQQAACESESCPAATAGQSLVQMRFKATKNVVKTTDSVLLDDHRKHGAVMQEDCEPLTRGTCRWWGCDSSRGETFCNDDKKCECAENYCANDARSACIQMPATPGACTTNYTSGDPTMPVPSTNLETWYTDSTYHSRELSDFPEQDADLSGTRPPTYVWNDCSTEKGPVHDQNTFLTWFPHAIKCTWSQSQTISNYDSIEEWWNAEHIGDHYGGESIDDALQGFSGYTNTSYNWQKATLAQLYSLIEFSGAMGTSAGDDYATVPADSIKFIDDTKFEVPFGDSYTSSGSVRWIDGQIWGDDNVQNSMQKYDSDDKLSREDDSVFGVNFLDGRIKSYPKTTSTGSAIKAVMFVAGDENAERFLTQGEFVISNNTVLDTRTQLMWEQEDSQEPLTWQDALQRCHDLVSSGYDDWRLPSIKELHTIVKYDTPVDTSGDRSRITDLKVIDDAFLCTKVQANGDLPGATGETYYGWYWSATTHLDGAPTSEFAIERAAYIAFGSALGYYNGELTDIHGAGAQRSDNKHTNYPAGAQDGDGYKYFGPQGDVVRSGNNLARCVRSAN